MIRNGNRLVVGGASVDNLVIQNCTIGGNEALSYDRGGLAVTWPVTNVVFRRCTVLGAQASGLWTYRPVTIEHCNFIGMGDGGIWLLGGSSGTVIRDCIFAGNGLAGLRVDGATRVLASNNCFFGNGEGNVFFTGVGKRWESASEINSCTQYASVFVNNIVTNPGFSALSRGWNDAVLYSNSPCLDAGTAGTDIGRHENPATVATSANTYYVKTNGDDSADGLTLGTAWATLPKATSVAVAGDTVVVQAGLYTNAVTITNGGSGPLTVRYRAPDGAAISNRLTLDRVGGVSMSGFEVMGTLTVTSSFGNVVSTGSVHHAVGDGIRLFYAPGNLLDSLAIHHNTGNGIYDRERSCALISRCRIYNNGGHGMLLGGASSTMMPGALRMWNANVFNNASNGVRMADAEYNLTKHEIVNSDLVGNGAQGLWIDDDTSAGFTLVNSIVADNAGGVWENGAGGDAVVSNCCFHANAGTNFFDEGVTVRDIAADINAVAGCVSNKVANPNFLPASGLAEFFLSSASPCLDSGTPVPFLATDLYGRPRIFHRQVDIGSCEFQVFGTFVILR
jgi:parallel beta-helix repeat protein